MNLIIAHAQGVAVSAPAGLVAWWPGNGNTVDVVGGHNGTLTNGETFGAGEVQQAFSGSGNHAGVFIGSPAALQLQNFTIEAWIRRASMSVVSSDPTANGGAAALFYCGSQGYGMGIHQGNGAISLTQIDVNDVNDGAQGACVTDTNWHHVAVTKSNTTVSFYVDGVAFPTVSYTSIFATNTPAAIGIRADNINANNNDSFAGEIDEMSIYNRALSAAEILSIFNAGSAGKILPILTISGNSASVTVSWASTVSSTLQQNTNLAGGSWTTSGFPITTVTGTNHITISPPTGNLFFRLHYP